MYGVPDHVVVVVKIVNNLNLFNNTKNSLSVCHTLRRLVVRALNDTAIQELDDTDYF